MGRISEGKKGEFNGDETTLKQRTSEIWHREKGSFRHDRAYQSPPPLYHWNTQNREQNVPTPYTKNHAQCQDLRESKDGESHYISDENKWMLTHSHPPLRGYTTWEIVPHRHQTRERVCVCAHADLLISLHNYTKTHVLWNPHGKRQEPYKPHFL